MHNHAAAIPALNRKRSFIIAALLLFCAAGLFSGCVNLVKGEYLLGAEQYAKGESVFRKAVTEKPDQAENWFYLGRFMLAQEKYAEANDILKKAVSLAPDNADYHFWLGVSYGGLKQTRAEVRTYKKTVELDPGHVKAHTYLGHSYFRQKKYKTAIKSYDWALDYSDYNPSAQYNKALLHYRLKAYPASREAFKQYVKKYRYSPRAVRATAYLNRMGDFDYRVHLFNKRRLYLEKMQFIPENGKLTMPSRRGLRSAGYMLEKDKDLELHVLAYEKNNLPLARKKAVEIKRYLLDFFPRINPGQVKVSFFAVPEKIRYGKKTYRLGSSINLFVAPAAVLK